MQERVAPSLQDHYSNTQELVALQLQFAHKCCTEAVTVVLSGRATWDTPAFPPKSLLQRAHKLCVAAQEALDAPYVAETQKQELRLAASATTAVQRDALRLSVVWPQVLLDSSNAFVCYFARKYQRALIFSQRAVSQLSLVSMQDAESIVTTALRAADGHMAVAEQCVALLSSHSAILHALQRDDDALVFSELAATLAHTLHDTLYCLAAHKLATHHAVPKKKEMSEWSSCSSFEKGVLITPSILAGRSPVCLLVATCLYNCCCIQEGILANSSCTSGLHKRQHATVRRCSPARLGSIASTALSFAESFLSANHSFVTAIRRLVSSAAALEQDAVRVAISNSSKLKNHSDRAQQDTGHEGIREESPRRHLRSASRASAARSTMQMSTTVLHIDSWLQ